MQNNHLVTVLVASVEPVIPAYPIIVEPDPEAWHLTLMPSSSLKTYEVAPIDG
jgi:hypothetical protein